MSGDNVPYHLRTNKFIERELFCELLERLGKWQPLSSYLYSSMGGAFLSDFKLLKNRLGLTKLLSIEQEPYVYSRQLFNRPSTDVVCRNVDSATLIADLESNIEPFKAENLIVWLDYAAANKRQEQIREFSTLLTKLGPNDVAKITLNCSARTLCDEYAATTPEQKQQIIYDNLATQLGGLYDLEDMTPAQMNNTGVCKALLEAVHRQCLSALEADRDNFVKPLSITRYADGIHEMLTVSVIILPIKEETKFLTATKLTSWPFYSSDWDALHNITSPELSFNERERIDQLSKKHRTPKALNTALEFDLASKEKESAKKIENYLTFREQCPYVFLSRSKDLPKKLKPLAGHFQ